MQTKPLINFAYKKVNEHAMGDGLQANELNAHMEKYMKIVMDWSAMAVEAACHENEPGKFHTVMPEKIYKQVSDDFVKQIKSSLDMLS